MALHEIFKRVCETKKWAVQEDTIEILLDGDRMQKITVTAFKHEGVPMARAFSTIGSARGLSETRLRSALNLNFNMPHGALALHDGTLVLTDTFLLRDADEGEVAASLRYLAQTADRYEEQIFGKDEN